MEFTTFGALVGLIIAIILIIKKVHPAYSLILGALIGGIAGALIKTGSTVIDSLPHGSFFHATGGSVNMQIRERMKLIPYEALVGLTSTIISCMIYLL